MKTTWCLLAAGVLSLGGTSYAQLAGVTPEMIASALPEEGAPKAHPGAYAVAAEPAFGAPGARCGLCTDTNWDALSKRLVK